MIASGVEAVLIKVAGIGLTAKHLGRTLAEMQPNLQRLVCCLLSSSIYLIPLLKNELYGLHICGEGGEYETLTLDCPLFKRRINLFVP